MNDIILENNNLIQQERFTEATDQFLASIVLAPTTKDAYRKGLKKFYTFMSDENITTINDITAVKYREYLLKNNKAPSVNLYLTAFKRLCKYLNKHYGIGDITEELKSVKITKGNKKDSLTLPQTKALLNLEMNKRDKAIIHLFITAGLREIELVRADIQDITNDGDRHILLVQGKGEETKNNFVILTDSTYKIINEYLAERKNLKPTDALFTSDSNRNNNGRLSTSAVRHLVKAKLREIGINTPRISTHSLRHTAINLIIDNGAELLEAQQFARHKSPTTTQQNYIDVRINTKAKGKSADILESVLNND